MPYVELHAASAFSFLRGASFPEQLAERAAELGLPAMALLDRNGVYGAQRFSAACRAKGVRPIIGASLTMEDGSLLPLLVENRRGYQNLCSLLTEVHLRSEKGSCLVRYAELEEFAAGLIGLFSPGQAQLDLGSARASCAISGASPQTWSRAQENNQSIIEPSAVRRGAKRSTRSARAPRKPAQRLQQLIDSLGQGNLYLELQRHFVRGEESVNRQLIALAEHFRLPLLATNGVQYATPRGREVLDVFTCIREHTHLDAAGKLLTKMPSVI